MDEKEKQRRIEAANRCGILTWNQLRQKLHKEKAERDLQKREQLAQKAKEALNQ